MEKTSFELLTEIQAKVGYKKGSINTVALLGLFGEAGEVLNECGAVDILPEHFMPEAVNYPLL
jgi:energy-converting hydrogenase Eha subunit H